MRRLVRDALELCAIPAPTFAEAARGEEVEHRLAAAGTVPRRDAAGNVLARIGGPGPAIVVAAHLDTVFDAATPLRPRQEGGRLHGPGIGDDAVALAALLGLARTFAAARPPAVPLLLAATVGEEGLGDLRGIRAVLDAEDAVCLVAIEGHGIDGLVIGGVASARLVADYRGPGGHSWRDRGTPSALHALLAAGAAAIAAGDGAAVNAGVAGGGVSINSIAPEAHLEIDIRDVDDAVVDAAAARVRAALELVPRGITADVRQAGRRPGGSIPETHPLVELALAARAGRGLDEPLLDLASTDANAAYGRGVPAVCLGLTRGGGVHTTAEWIETAPLEAGVGALERLVRDLTAGRLDAAGYDGADLRRSARP